MKQLNLFTLLLIFTSAFGQSRYNSGYDYHYSPFYAPAKESQLGVCDEFTYPMSDFAFQGRWVDVIGNNWHFADFTIDLLVHESIINYFGYEGHHEIETACMMWNDANDNLKSCPLTSIINLKGESLVSNKNSNVKPL